MKNQLSREGNLVPHITLENALTAMHPVTEGHTKREDAGNLTSELKSYRSLTRDPIVIFALHC